MTLAHTILAGALLLGALLLGFAVVLAPRRLFHWSNAGFWTVVSLMLYLCVNPAVRVLSGGSALHMYAEGFRYTEQSGRVWWITLVCIAGGLAEHAGDHILLTTPGPQGPITRDLPVRSVLFGNDPRFNPLLTGGDEVRVLPAGRVYVAGRRARARRFRAARR